MTTERLLFQQAKNQKACTDDAGFERPCETKHVRAEQS